jgi:hypothetical protein
MTPATGGGMGSMAVGPSSSSTNSLWRACLREKAPGWLVVLTFPSCFLFRMIVPLDFIESSNLPPGDSVLLFMNLDGIDFVGQVRFQ